MPKFLFPVDGAMNITEYLHADVFKSGLLSNVEFGADQIWYVVSVIHEISCY